MADRSPKSSKASSKSSTSQRKVTVRSSVKKSAPLASGENQIAEPLGVASNQKSIGNNQRIDHRNDRVALIFLGVFVAALFFVLGAGFGNTQGNAIVD